MDLIKEREAFEDWFAERYPNIQKTIDNHRDHYSLVFQSNQYEAWVEAKKQAETALLEQFEINNKLVEQIEKLKAKAIPDGFVWVKIYDLELLRDSALEIKYASLNSDSDRIYSDIEDIQLSVERLIEAQEQSNDS